MNPADRIFGYMRQKPLPISSENELFHLFFNTTVPNIALQHTIMNNILEGDGRFSYDSYNKMWYANGDDTAKNITAAEYTVIDIETTGFNPDSDKITEIAAIKIRGGEIDRHINFLVNPARPIPLKITEITGIRDDMVAAQPYFRDIVPALREFIESNILVAHHSSFDISFINAELKNAGVEPLHNITLCTCKLAKKLLPHLSSYALDSLAKNFRLTFLDRHRAYPDALVTAQVFQRFFPIFKENELQKIEHLVNLIQ
ncbi:3'-5' exonuclease [bacterium]|nr:3'-5' exonuclease [bacterium]